MAGEQGAFSVGESMSPRGGGKMALLGAVQYFLEGAWARNCGAWHGIALSHSAFGVATLYGLRLRIDIRSYSVIDEELYLYTRVQDAVALSAGRASRFPT